MREEERRIIALAKLMLLVMIGLIIAEIGSCARQAKAGVITGEKQLGGASLIRQKVIDKDGFLIDHDDLDLLAEVMYWENYSNGTEAMILTGSVVLNRVASPRWPNTIREVLYERDKYIQYSTTDKFFTKAIPDECKEIALHLLMCGSQAPKDVVYQAMFKQGNGVYKQIKTDYFCYE